jgi:DNA replication protein DnaC
MADVPLTMPAQGFPDANATHPSWDDDAYTIVRRGERAVAVMAHRPACPLCSGSGRARIERDGLVQMGRCRCQRLPDRIRLFNSASLPARFADATFVSFAQEPDGTVKELDASAYLALTQCAEFVESFDPTVQNQGLVLHGPVGRGKTHMMVAMLRALVMQHGIEVRFIEFSRLLSLLKEGYSAGRSDGPVLSELANVPVLAIDELGKGRLSDWELAVIDEVVSRRYNAVGCMIATSNYAPGDATGVESINLAVASGPVQCLTDRVGERVYSRLCQMVDFVELSGRDHRQLN